MFLVSFFSGREARLFGHPHLTPHLSSPLTPPPRRAPTTPRPTSRPPRPAMAILALILKVVMAILLPPLAVFLEVGEFFFAGFRAEQRHRARLASRSSPPPHPDVRSRALWRSRSAQGAWVCWVLGYFRRVSQGFAAREAARAPGHLSARPLARFHPSSRVRPALTVRAQTHPNPLPAHRLHLPLRPEHPADLAGMAAGLHPRAVADCR